MTPYSCTDATVTGDKQPLSQPMKRVKSTVQAVQSDTSLPQV